MTKGQELFDKWIKLILTLPVITPETSPSVYFSNYQKQIEFFDKIYEDAWRNGVEDSKKIDSNMQN